MTLLSPIWLLLAIPLAVSMWLWRMPTRLLTVMRIIVLALLLLGLSGLAVKLPSRAGTVVVVADRSRSMPPGAAAAELEAIQLIQREMGGGDRLAVVSFGEEVALERPPQEGEFGGFVNAVGTDASNLHGAVESALSLIGPRTPGRVLVLSDGRWTGKDPVAIAARAAARGVAVDYRAMQRPTTGDLAIESIDAPPSVAPREAYMVTAWVRSPEPREIEYELRRGGARLAAGRQQVPAGLSRLVFRDSAPSPSTMAYTLSVRGAEDDPVPENNQARVLVGVEGPRPILLLTQKTDSGFARLLSAGGLDIQPRQPDEAAWSLTDLSNYSAVIVEAVPANEIGLGGMENLAQWVRGTGSGLMMTGGQTAYGPGGYFRSPLEPIMPVSMEMRREHRKHSLAIVVAMDRSGSMAVPVGGGRTKMDLANLAAAQVVDMLTAMDELGVLAVDSQAHEIVPLQRLDDKPAIKDSILRVDSMGGGIFVYEALSRAASMLQNSTAGARHIILFADAADSEEPGQYRQLLEHCREAGITCSVIGLGTEGDVDAGLLKDIAQRGGGRAFFTQNPEELPRLFAQDTFVVARSSFVDELTPVQATAALHAMTGRGYDPPPPPVGGYNLTYLREGANLAMLTQDEYNAPVVAAWQAGAGRVLCYTAQAEGKFTGPIAGWERIGDFFTGMARWTAGDPADLPDNMLLTQRVREGIAYVELHLDPEREVPGLAEMPGVTVLRGVPGRPPVAMEAQMEWTSPDTLGIEVPLRGSETAISTVRLAGQPPIALPPVTLPYSPEFRPVVASRGTGTLDRMATVTGGTGRVDLGGIWGDLPKRPRLMDLSPWLLVAAVIVLLLEVLERRTGVLSTGRFTLTRDRPKATAATATPTPAPGAPKPARRPAPTAPPKKTQPAPAPSATPGSPGSPEEKPVTEPAANVLDALGQARRRAQQRRGGKR